MSDWVYRRCDRCGKMDPLQSDEGHLKVLAQSDEDNIDRELDLFFIGELGWASDGENKDLCEHCAEMDCREIYLKDLPPEERARKREVFNERLKRHKLAEIMTVIAEIKHVL